MNQQINLNCDSVTMPSHDLQTQSVQYGSEPARDIVTSHALQELSMLLFMLTNI